MKTSFSKLWRLLCITFACWLECAVATPTNQLVSALGPEQSFAAGGGGDSMGAIFSPDGRYVLFASVANNLATTSAHQPLPAYFPAPLNVFLRDRTNGTTTLVSMSLDGTGGGNGDSVPIGVSTNGQFVVFESSASNLVANDTNGVADVFVRDLAGGTTLLVSVATDGGMGNGACRGSAMTPDGRYVAFISGASNVVAGDTNGIPDVFVRDLQNGITTLASVGAQRRGVATSIPTESAPGITPDGRYVVFHSGASNLVSGITATNDIYVRDLVGGTTVWASAGAVPAVQSVMGTSNAFTFNYAMSADGQFVAYEASPPMSAGGLILRYNVQTEGTDVVHTNAAVTSTVDICGLDMTPDGRFIAFVANTNGVQGEDSCVLVWDVQSGVTRLASGDSSGTVPAGSTCDWPVISPDGRFVAFLSSAPGLVTNALSGDYHCYLRDLQTGSTILVDTDTNAVGALLTSMPLPSMDASGRFVAFEAPDSNLVPADRNRSYDVFLRDLAAGGTEMVSVHDVALPSLSPNGGTRLFDFCVSSDGRYVAFLSDADNLAPIDTNGCSDIFVHDLLTRSNILASASMDGVTTGNGLSTGPSMSADGRFVLFTSAADNLVGGDTNQATDVFVRDLQTGRTTLVSVNSAGTGPGNGDSYGPVPSAGGRYALFRSKATNLAPGTFSGANLFWRDLQSAKTYALSTSGAPGPVGMTPDGRYAVFLASSQFNTYLYVWDAQFASRVYTNTTSGISAAAISPDGRTVLYWNSAGLYAVDRLAGTSTLVTTSRQPSHPGLRFSSDSRSCTYAGAAGTGATIITNQVYRYDVVAKTALLVSHSSSGPSVPANASSDSPDISADGRFVVYRSYATDLAGVDTNGVPDIFLFDSQSGTTTLVSLSLVGSYSANNRSLTPFFSRDGSSLCFVSWAADLVPGDFNAYMDVLSYNLYSAGVPLGFQVALWFDSKNWWITWPVAAGTNYSVEFKNSLAEQQWQSVNSGITVIGNTAYCNDPGPQMAGRFYRVVGF